MTPSQYTAATTLLNEKAVLIVDIGAWAAIRFVAKDSDGPKIEFKCDDRSMPIPPADEFKRFNDAVVAKLKARLKAIDDEFAAL